MFSKFKKNRDLFFLNFINDTQFFYSNALKSMEDLLDVIEYLFLFIGSLDSALCDCNSNILLTVY